MRPIPAEGPGVCRALLLYAEFSCLRPSFPHPVHCHLGAGFVSTPFQSAYSSLRFHPPVATSKCFRGKLHLSPHRRNEAAFISQPVGHCLPGATCVWRDHGGASALTHRPPLGPTRISPLYCQSCTACGPGMISGGQSFRNHNFDGVRKRGHAIFSRNLIAIG